MIEAFVGGLGIASTLTLAICAITATRRAGNHQARADALAVRLENMTARRDDESRRADYEKERANALDDLLAEAAAANTGPVDGAYQRLLQKWASASPKNGDASRAVPALPAASEPGPDELLPFPR